MISEALKTVAKEYLKKSEEIEPTQICPLVEIMINPQSHDLDFLEKFSLMFRDEEESYKKFKQIWRGFWEALRGEYGRSNALITKIENEDYNEEKPFLFKILDNYKLIQILEFLQPRDLRSFAAISQRGLFAARTVEFGRRGLLRFIRDRLSLRGLITIPVDNVIKVYEGERCVGAVPCNVDQMKMELSVDPLILDDNTIMVVLRRVGVRHAYINCIVVCHPTDANVAPQQLPYQEKADVLRITQLPERRIMIDVWVTDEGVWRSGRFEIHIVDRESGKVINKIPDLGRSICSTVVCDNEILVAVDNKIKIYNLEGRFLRSLAWDGVIGEIALHEGKIVIAFQHGAIQVCDFQSGIIIKTIPWSDVPCMVLMPDNCITCYSPVDYKIGLFDLNSDNNMLIRTASYPPSIQNPTRNQLYMAAVRAWPDLYGQKQSPQLDNSNSNSPP